MRLRILPAVAALAAVTLTSCYVLPDPPPENPQQKKETTVTDKEQQAIEAQREKKKQEDALNKPADPGPVNNPDAPPPTNKPKQSAPTAQPVPGKEGYVFSPFNQKIVDVREIPSGTLVADPTYPASEKKHFRVP